MSSCCPYIFISDGLDRITETRFSEYHVEMGTTRKVMEGFSSAFAQIFAWINLFFKSRTQKRRCYRTLQYHQICQKMKERRVQPVSKLIFSWIWWLHEIPILSTRSVIRHYFSLLNWTSKTNTRSSCILLLFMSYGFLHLNASNSYQYYYY